jgi:superfamily II DNA or RNA helicase
MLYHHQEVGAEILTRALGTWSYALDASGTGTGKTYTALAVAQRLSTPPLVICPKSVITAWKNAALDLGVPLTGVINAEMLKTGKTPWLQRHTKAFTWNIPKGDLVIWDEVHGCGGIDTQNAVALALLKPSGVRCLMLSATLADTPLRLKSPGYLLGLHGYSDFYDWALRHGCERDYRLNPPPIVYMPWKDPGAFLRLHGAIFQTDPPKGLRVTLQELGDLPPNVVQATTLDFGEKETKALENAYLELLAAQGKDPQTELASRTRARQFSENMKIPAMVELAKAETGPVILFVTYRPSALQLHGELGGSLVIGEQTDRDEQIAAFQRNDTRYCVCTYGAGGASISLDDRIGTHPRTVFLSPTDSSREMKQALGRAFRRSTKSRVRQVVLFAAHTIEERICASLRRKLTRIDELNDGDLSPERNF